MKKYTHAWMTLAFALACSGCSHIPLIGHRAAGGDETQATAAKPEPAAPAATPPTANGTNASASSESAQDRHIELKYAFKTNATPDRAYEAITGPARWWDSSNTYSGSASNLSLDAHAGGCWCERLADGGSVQHMSVLTAMPGRMLRLSGGLGPLQGGAVNAVMTWTIQRAGSGSEVDMSYLVDGYFPGGLGSVRGDVDAVLGHQVERLRAYLDGK